MKDKKTPQELVSTLLRDAVFNTLVDARDQYLFDRKSKSDREMQNAAQRYAKTMGLSVVQLRAAVLYVRNQEDSMFEILDAVLTADI